MSDPVSIDKATVGVTDVVLLAGMVSDSITRKYPDDANKINTVSYTHLTLPTIYSV